MKTLSERMRFLLSQREVLEKWVAKYDHDSLRKWLRAEIGDEGRLDKFVDGSRVVAREPVLHVVSGNTEHAAFQSVFRAILVGCRLGESAFGGSSGVREMGGGSGFAGGEEGVARGVARAGSCGDLWRGGYDGLFPKLAVAEDADHRARAEAERGVCFRGTARGFSGSWRKTSCATASVGVSRCRCFM